MILIGFGIFLDILLVLQNHEMPWVHIVRCRCSHTGTEQGFYLDIRVLSPGLLWTQAARPEGAEALSPYLNHLRNLSLK